MLIQMHVYVPIETAKPELTEAVEEKQSQILGRLLKKSLHRNQATLEKVRTVCIMLGGYVCGLSSAHCKRNIRPSAREWESSGVILQKAHGWPHGSSRNQVTEGYIGVLQIVFDQLIDCNAGKYDQTPCNRACLMICCSQQGVRERITHAEWRR